MNNNNNNYYQRNKERLQKKARHSYYQECGKEKAKEHSKKITKKGAKNKHGININNHLNKKKI